MGSLLQLASLALRAAIVAPVVYLYLLAIASVRRRGARPNRLARHRFAIAIPAHNEAAVIASTIQHLRQLDYPVELVDIHVVADHCSDLTAAIARPLGAIVHERSDAPGGSKGAALRWLFLRILDERRRRPGEQPYDAVVVFDADTHVAPNFLHLVDARLQQGAQVVQGQHVIRNPEDGWVPALIWAMFLIDNRLQNLGRTALGWSAKNMGDSICFRADVLRRLGWGEGLTEDYAFRQQLLLEGIKIQYEPDARGYGEAPSSWAAARTQRSRWLRGTGDVSQRFARRLLIEGLRRRDLPLLDGALQAHLPSYSTLTMLSMAGCLASIGVRWLRKSTTAADRSSATRSWAALAAALFVYPLLGLALERAPVRAYVAILLGPAFVVWRTWLALVARFGAHETVWIRTERRAEHVRSKTQGAA